MSDSDSEANTSEKQIRTFCLITGLPENGYDEKLLRQSLRTQTVGMLKVLHCPEEGCSHPRHALALFESRGAALDAAAAASEGKVLVVVPASKSLTGKEEELALKLFPIREEKATAPELTFQDTIQIEGEAVLKSDLVETVGLMSVLKTFEGYSSGSVVSLSKSGGPGSVARWCRKSKDGKDCPWGNQCWSIHKKEFQVTVTPHPEFLLKHQQKQHNNNNNNNNKNDGGGGGSEAKNTADEKVGDQRRRPRSGGENNDDDDETMKSVSVSQASLRAMQAIPQEWRNDGENIPLSHRDVQNLLLLHTNDNNDTKSSNNGSTKTTTKEKIITSLQTAMNSLLSKKVSKTGNKMPLLTYFVKFDIPHGSPSDCIQWSDGGYETRKEHDASVRLKYDVLLHRALRASHRSLAVADAKEGLELLLKSKKAMSALEKAAAAASTLQQKDKEKEEEHDGSGVVSLRVEPFDYSLWSPISQFQLIVRGRRYCGSAQRVSWVLVDVANRFAAENNSNNNGEDKKDTAAAAPIITQQLNLVNDWRHEANEHLKKIISDALPSLLPPTPTGEQQHQQPQQQQKDFNVCINAATCCSWFDPSPTILDQDRNNDRVYNNPLSSFSPRILSVHDAAEAIGQSNLLPFVEKSNPSNVRVVFRVKTHSRLVPGDVQRQILDKHPDVMKPS